MKVLNQMNKICYKMKTIMKINKCPNNSKLNFHMDIEHSQI